MEFLCIACMEKGKSGDMTNFHPFELRLSSLVNKVDMLHIPAVKDGVHYAIIMGLLVARW